MWNPFAHKKYDLFWIADYVGLPRLNSPWFRKVNFFGVQVCQGSDLASHRTDLLTKTPKKQALKRWLWNGNYFELHSWQKEAIHGRGKRKDWTLSREIAILSPTGNVSFCKEEP